MRSTTPDLDHRNARRRHLVAGALLPAFLLVGAACSTADDDTGTAAASDPAASASADSNNSNDAIAATTSTTIASSSTSAASDGTSATTQTTTVPVPVADGSGCSPAGDSLDDGRWFGYVTGASADQLEFDLACRFSDEQASLAQVEDGEDPLVIDDYYVRNESTLVRTLPVTGDVPVDWHPDGQPISEPTTYAAWSFEQNRFLGAWVTISGGQVVAIAEQWAP